jgi:hypothetical protein
VLLEKGQSLFRVVVFEGSPPNTNGFGIKNNGLIPNDFRSISCFCNLLKYQFQTYYFGQEVNWPIFQVNIPMKKKQPVTSPVVFKSAIRYLLIQHFG